MTWFEWLLWGFAAAYAAVITLGLVLASARIAWKVLRQRVQTSAIEADDTQRDYGDETDPPAPQLPPGHPGDGLTPLAYLPDAEWRLWTSVIAETAR